MPAGVTNVMYGGRVHTAADSRILTALVLHTLAEHVYGNNWTPSGLSQPLPNAKNLQASTYF